MNFNIKKITGKIIIDSKIVGTGFLVTNDLFITAAHNIFKSREGVPSEKEIIIRFEDNEVKGKSINLIEVYNKRIDIVFIKLKEPIFDLNFTKIISSPKSFKNCAFKTYGYPNEKQEGYYLDGEIILDEKIDNNLDICLSVNKRYFLSSYSGLSGAPVCINNFIVGILIQQETEKNLFGISFSLIEEILDNLPTEIFPLEKKELKQCSTLIINQISNNLDGDFFSKHIEEAFSFAGPRYSQEVNIENTTLKNLKIFSGQYDFSKNLSEDIKNISSQTKYLGDCIKDKDNNIFTEESRNNIIKIKEKLEEVLVEFENLIVLGALEDKINFFDTLDVTLESLSQKLNQVFTLELKNFENKYGKDTFENKSWRGFMASYQCSFPTANLENIQNLIKSLGNLKSHFSSNLLELYFSKTLLLKGRGGVGKTHSLCDIVNYNIQNEIPSLIFFGQYFRDKSPEKVILEKLSLDKITFEEFLYQLDNIGYRNNKNILICIDAINETNDKSYWNNYLTLFTEKIKKYKHIKLIISCRSLYLDEVLDTGTSNRYLIIEHDGFEKVGSKAVMEYFKYYNLTLPYTDKMQNEFNNPLFLKLYCETLSEKKIDDSNFNIDSLSSLFKNFFEIKNEKISKKFSDYLSPNDNLVFECISKVSNTMKEKKSNYLNRREVKKIIKNFLIEELDEDKLSSKLILDELILENILKEDVFEDGTVSFSFERFFDYTISKNIINLEESKFIENIDYLKNNPSIYMGVLELLMILYKEECNKELIKEYNLEEDIFYKAFILSLSWRKNESIDEETKSLFDYCLKELQNKDITEISLFTLYELSLKKNCILNAIYFHELFKNQNNDNFLGYWMLKSYEKHMILDKILNNSIFFKEKNIDLEIIKLWIIILGWLTSLNDINIRDRASKGLTNLLRLYPEIISYMITKFENIEDDYIQERLWGSIYGSLILTKNVEQIKQVVKIIYVKYIQDGNFPENVLLRDFLRNIAELASFLNILEFDITLFRPPYKSNNIKKIKISNKNISKEYKKLFWNCTESDFGIYTIPNEVEDYGFSKEEVGELVYNEIINYYKLNRTIELDNYIDFTYGSLRNRDESVERVSKKYQNIFLRRVLGRIFDNYISNPKYKYSDEKEIIPKEQGNNFRDIDLTSLPYEKLEHNFIGKSLTYDFRKINNLDAQEWFLKEDIINLSCPLIQNYYLDEEYLLLKGDFKVENIDNKNSRHELWFQIKSYFIKIEDVDIFNNWVKNKHFWGQWMPSGYESLYEGWIGEYPWSTTYINILEEEEKEKNLEEKIEIDINTHYENLAPEIKSIWDEFNLLEDISKTLNVDENKISTNIDEKIPPVNLSNL